MPIGDGWNGRSVPELVVVDMVVSGGDLGGPLSMPAASATRH
ncbi:hypothetical protein [Serinicoccus marinus]|nr:hypothetical protein [Serinicoccus marinus]